MSSYMSFFIRSYNDELMPIGTYGRSTNIYQVFSEYIPYGKVIPLTKDYLTMICSEISNRKETAKKSIRQQEEKKQFLKEMNFSDQMVETLEEILYELDEWKENLQELEITSNFISFLKDMMREMENLEDYYYDQKFVPSEEYVFVGIDVEEYPEFITQKEGD